MSNSDKKLAKEFADSLNQGVLIQEKENKIAAILRQIPELARDLEVEALDLYTFKEPLAKGKFPVEHLVHIQKRLDKYKAELDFIVRSWSDVFAEEIEVKNG